MLRREFSHAVPAPLPFYVHSLDIQLCGSGSSSGSGVAAVSNKNTELAHLDCST